MADIELVIKLSEEMYKWVNDSNKFFNDYGISDFIDLVKNGTSLPLEQQSKWIPVSSGKLPEHNMSVLITLRRYDDEVVVRSGYYYANGDSSIFHADNGNCWKIDEEGLLAWQPLPKPYEPQESEDKE